MNFNVNDLVEFGGLEGKVVAKNDDIMVTTRPLVVRFRISDEESATEYFTLDGKYKTYHTAPSLRLILRARTKKQRFFWCNLYPHDVATFHKSKLEALKVARGGCPLVIAVKTVVEYEE